MEKENKKNIPKMSDFANIEISDEAEALIKKLRKDAPAHNVGILEEAIAILKKEDFLNKDAKDALIYFLQGQQYELSAKVATSNKRQLELLKKAENCYVSTDDLRRVEVKQLAVKASLIMHKDQDDKKEEIGSKSKKLFDIAKKLEALGNKKDAKTILVIHKMLEAGSKFNNKPEALSLIKEAENLCRETDFKDGVHKMKSLRYNFEAHYQPTPQKAISYMKKSLEEILKTADKHGKEKAEGDIYYLEALMTKDVFERADKFEKAGNLFLKSKFPKEAYDAMGRAYQTRVHIPKIPIKEVLKFQKQSFIYYKKAGNIRAYHNMQGGYYSLQAIRLGIFEGKDKFFLKNASKALEEYKKAGNSREAEYLLGNIALTSARYLPAEERIQNLQVAGEILNKHHEGLGSFAYYHYYIDKANVEIDERQSNDFRKRALEHLDKFIKHLEHEYDNEDRREEVDEWIKNKQTPMLLVLKSDYHRLKAKFILSQNEKSDEYNKAFKCLNKIVEEHPAQLILAKFNLGLLFIETGDYDKAISELNEANRQNPLSSEVEQAKIYATKLLKDGFRKLKEEENLRREFFISQTNPAPAVPTSLEAFIPQVSKIIFRRGQNFERSPDTYNQKKENELRDEILNDLNLAFPGDATAESKIGNGKTDLRIKNPLDHMDEAIGECKWWSGESDYIKAKNQLFGYLTPRQTYCFLITFCSRKDFYSVFSSAENAIQNMDDYVKDSLQEPQQSFGEKKFWFISRHQSNSGGKVHVYNIFFHIPNIAIDD